MEIANKLAWDVLKFLLGPYGLLKKKTGAEPYLQPGSAAAAGLEPVIEVVDEVVVAADELQPPGRRLSRAP